MKAVIPKPVLLAMKGPMGVGKSATARALGKALNWPVVDKDDASDILVEHLDNYGSIAYNIMFKQAESLLNQGFNVILDSPFRSRLGYDHAVEITDKLDVGLKIVECYCSNQSEWSSRLETRNRRPAHIIKDWNDFEAYWQKAEKDFDYDIEHPILKIDTVDAIEINIETIVDFLKN